MHDLSNEALLAAVSLIVAALTVLLPLFWRVLQSRRLLQEEAIHRESHNLKLFKALASKNHQLQLAAAAVLAEKLVSKVRRDTKSEHRIIIRALLAVTKDIRSSETDTGTPVELSKFVADQIAKHHKIALHNFDWQNTQLSGAWWPSIDVSSVDFWKSDLSSSSMRRANFKNSVLVETRLDNSVLVGANLEFARLERSNLCGTDLRETNVKGASFTGASYDSSTKFPDDFSPEENGLVFSQLKTATSATLKA